MKRFSMFALVVLVFVASASAQFTFTSIDFPGGIPLTQADDINALGQIAGRYIDAGGAQHAFMVRPMTKEQQN